MGGVGWQGAGCDPPHARQKASWLSLSSVRATVRRCPAAGGCASTNPHLGHGHTRPNADRWWDSQSAKRVRASGWSSSPLRKSWPATPAIAGGNDSFIDRQRSCGVAPGGGGS